MRVRWSDSCHWAPGTWVSLEKLTTSPCEVVTVGWLIARNKHCITVAQSITEAGDAAGVFVIPAACVNRIVKL